MPARRLALVALMLVAVGLRLGYAWSGWEPVADARAYAALAANLERENAFGFPPPGQFPEDEDFRATQEATNYSPGLPLLAGGIYTLRGEPDERLVRILLALLASLAVLFSYLIAVRLGAPTAGLATAGAIAIYPAFLQYGGMLMTEPLAAALISGAVLALLRGLDSGNPAGFIPAGLALGAAALVRPEYLGIGVLAALVVLALGVRATPKAAALRAAVVLTGIAVVVVPWTVRNAIVLDRFVPISTGGGQVLFAGTYLPSDGDPERVGAEVLERNPGLRRRIGDIPGPAGQPPLEVILAALARERHPGLETDVALGRMGREQLGHNITDEPLRYAGFVATKIVRIWSRGPREVMEMTPWRVLHLLIAVPGLIGLVLVARRRPREAALIAAFLLGITAISALLVASPRRGLVLLPVVAALAAVAFTEGAAHILPRWKPSARAGTSGAG